jgi:hypothetical protein
MCFLVLVLINENEYDSRIRVSIMKMVVVLKLNLDDFYKAEEELAIQLKKSLQEIQEVSKEKKENVVPMLHRLALVGFGSFFGGLSLMMAGLVVAPIVIPAALTIVGLSSLAGSAVVLFGGPLAVAAIFGLTGSGLVGYMITKRTAGLTQFQFQKIPITEEVTAVKVIESKNPLLDIETVHVTLDDDLFKETESNDHLIHEDDLILTENDEKVYKKVFENVKQDKVFVKEENNKFIIKSIQPEKKIQLSKFDEIFQLLQVENLDKLEKKIPPPVEFKFKLIFTDF